MRLDLLGGLTPRAFLRGHWQKRALFVPQALPAFPGVIEPRSLAALATRDDVESRIVRRHGRRWRTEHGPFRRIAVARRDWTLLVSGVNLYHRSADALLRRFAFAPQARLDDLMVSYATPGGGVGPHVDSYDVFLLQGPGRRRWTYWDPRGTRFRVVAAPGDLLYLPPGWKHDGVALEPCFTYSIGFRAPAGAELGAAFLDWLHERGLPQARYRDPGLAPAVEPARIPGALVSFAVDSLARIRWSAADVADFLGRHLTQPKPHVVFAPGRAARPLRAAMVLLDPKTQLLYRGRRFFMNGEAFTVPLAAAARLRALANARRAPGAGLARAGIGALLGEWRRRGYLHYEAPDG